MITIRVIGIGIGEGDVVGTGYVDGFDAGEESGDVFRGSGESFDSYDPFEDGGGLGIVCGCRYDSGTVDKVDSTGKGDILPDLCFTGNRSDSTNFTTFESVDYTAFSDVRVAYESNGDLFFV